MPIKKKIENKDIEITYKIKFIDSYRFTPTSYRFADVFENFRKACIKTYELDPAHFISLPGLAWQTCLKKTGVELELLTDYDMLLMIEEGIRGGICHAVHRYARANNKYMKNYDRSKESSYIQYLDTNNLYGAAMSEKLPINGFKWVNDISGINKKFVKSYDKQ